MNDRLNKLLKEKDITPNRLAKLLDIQPSAVSHILSGRNRPGYSVIVKMLETFPDINPRWLLYGSGAMYENENKAVPSIPKENAAAQKALFPEIRAGYSDDAPLRPESSGDDSSDFAPPFGLVTESQSDRETVSGSEPDVPGNPLQAEADSKPASMAELAGNKTETAKMQSAELYRPAGKTSRLKRIVLIYEDNTFEVLDQH